MRKSWLTGFGLVSAAIAVLVFGAATAGAQITVGQVAPTGATLLSCNSAGGYDEAQKQVADGASYTVPTAGVLTSWSTRSAVGGQFGLKVYRSILGGYLVVAADGPKTLSPSGINTFPVSIPVQPGDLVGSSTPPGTTNCLFETGLGTDQIIYASGNQPVGGTALLANPEMGYRVNLSATLLPAPTITSLSPSSGSIAGRNGVTIAGTNFASISSVTFGGVPALSYKADSENQITAIAPPSKLPGSVAVKVTTAAGTANSVQAYSYRACTVPKLKGKSLKGAKKAIKKAGCKVGKVTKLEGATGKTGKVSQQKPKAGSVVVTGTQVKISLKPPQ